VFGVLDSHQDSLSELADGIGELDGRSDDEGVRVVVAQRHTQAFLGLEDDQFAQYVFSTFREFLGYLGSGRATS
jgi:hypothetical protein